MFQAGDYVELVEQAFKTHPNLKGKLFKIDGYTAKSILVKQTWLPEKKAVTFPLASEILFRLVYRPKKTLITKLLAFLGGGRGYDDEGPPGKENA